MTITMTMTTTAPAPVAPAPAPEAPARRAGAGTAGRWATVCRLDDVTPDRGVAALVGGGHQVAVFVLSPLPGGEPSPGGSTTGPSAGAEVYAVDNHDPYSGANVIARGLVGSAGDRPVVASPIYKQRFDLRDGTCLDGDVPLRAWPTRVVDGWVEVAGLG